MRMDGETPLAAGVRIMPLIAAGVLPIQGLPWTLHQAWPQRRAAIHALRPKTCRSRMSDEAAVRWQFECRFSQRYVFSLKAPNVSERPKTETALF
jgi:hypothetical protein